MPTDLKAEHGAVAGHAERRTRARERLGQRAPGLEFLLLTCLPNVRYLTGFSGSNAVLALHADNPERDLLGTDGRYAEQVAAQAPDLATVIERATLSAVAGRVPSPPGRVGIESTMTLQDWGTVRHELGGDPVVVEGLVEELRVIKDPAELAVIERACSITAQSFEQLASQLRPGMTEIAVARSLEQLFGELGAPDRAFASIVGSGPNSAIPHHRCSERPLEPGDLLVIDAGAQVDGYHADMTRTMVVAREPAPWQRKIHQVVLDAQAAARAAAQPGASLSSVDAAARQLIGQAGYGEAFVHGLGHGVGLAIHEAPMIGARSTGTITASTAITIEPGIYLPGRGGVRIEDTMLVESAGSRVLTEMPRDLLVVG